MCISPVMSLKIMDQASICSIVDHLFFLDASLLSWSLIHYRAVHALLPSQHNAFGLQGILCKMKGSKNLFLNLGQLSDLLRTQ